jgi:hypothetical protein
MATTLVRDELIERIISLRLQVSKMWRPGFIPDPASLGKDLDSHSMDMLLHIHKRLVVSVRTFSHRRVDPSDTSPLGGVSKQRSLF